MALGNASAFAPDAGKAKVSAQRIFKLLDARPTIDSNSTEGSHLPVSYGLSFVQCLCPPLSIKTIHYVSLVAVPYPVNSNVVVFQENYTPKVVFKDVEFSYPTRPDSQILHKVNVCVEEGKTVALVGSSGCGKSTIVQLIERFYDPVGGSVVSSFWTDWHTHI